MHGTGEVKIEVTLRPFSVPNFVLVEWDKAVERGEAPKYAVKDLPRHTLLMLCAEFQREVLEKAGYSV